MRAPRMIWIGLASTLCFGLGCSAVLSTHPVGAEPAAVEDGWGGTWIGDDGPLVIRVVDAEDGRLEAAWIDTAEDGEFTLETLKIELRRLEDWTMANVRGLDEGDDRYRWMRVERDDDRLLVWLPAEDEFERLVTSGKLPGSVEDDEVVLGRLAPEQLALVRDESGGPLFVWDEPLVLRRLDF